MDKNSDLINVVKYMAKKQHIMLKMLIHLGFRSDLYDDFIRGCFSELDDLKFDYYEEADETQTTAQKCKGR